MPPVQRPRPARPQTDRCRYADRKGQRCRRVATVGDGFCRQHAAELEFDLGEGAVSGLIGVVDRLISNRGRAPLGAVLGGVLNDVLGSRQAEKMVPRAQLDELMRHLQAQQAAAARQARQAPRQPPPAAPPPRVWVDPLLAAREVLGFEPTEKLTRERVQERKKALARVFHPDMPGGSKAAMQRVLTSADALLAKIA